MVEVCAKSGRGIEALMQEFDTDEARDCSDETEFDGPTHTTSLKGDKKARGLLKSQRCQQAFNAAKTFHKSFAFPGLAF